MNLKSLLVFVFLISLVGCQGNFMATAPDAPVRVKAFAKEGTILILSSHPIPPEQVARVRKCLEAAKIGVEAIPVAREMAASLPEQGSKIVNAVLDLVERCVPPDRQPLVKAAIEGALEAIPNGQ